MVVDGVNLQTAMSFSVRCTTQTKRLENLLWSQSQLEKANATGHATAEDMQLQTRDTRTSTEWSSMSELTACMQH